MLCPNCGLQLPDNSLGCSRCGMSFNYPQQQVQQQYYVQPQQYPQQNYTQMNYPPQQVQPMFRMDNTNIMPCHACHNMMGRYADRCPYCGTPRPLKVANPILLDFLAVIAIAIAVLGYSVGFVFFSFGVMFLNLIIYAIYYGIIKDNPDIDASKVKHSLNIITVLFIIMFCVGVVVIIF